MFLGTEQRKNKTSILQCYLKCYPDNVAYLCFDYFLLYLLLVGTSERGESVLYLQALQLDMPAFEQLFIFNVLIVKETKHVLLSQRISNKRHGQKHPIALCLPNPRGCQQWSSRLPLLNVCVIPSIVRDPPKRQECLGLWKPVIIVYDV